jgi:hypothetical protein
LLDIVLYICGSRVLIIRVLNCSGMGVGVVAITNDNVQGSRCLYLLGVVDICDAAAFLKQGSEAAPMGSSCRINIVGVA